MRRILNIETFHFEIPKAASLHEKKKKKAKKNPVRIRNLDTYINIRA
jgi:hypothetical protein